MTEWLTIATEYAAFVLDSFALVIIVFGSIQAFVSGLYLMLTTPMGHERRDVWLRYARWLVAGLTFQLAADILETAVTMEWEALGRLAALAIIRTFLNYFLERDLTEVRARQHEPAT